MISNRIVSIGSFISRFEKAVTKKTDEVLTGAHLTCSSDAVTHLLHFSLCCALRNHFL